MNQPNPHPNADILARLLAQRQAMQDGTEGFASGFTEGQPLPTAGNPVEDPAWQAMHRQSVQPAPATQPQLPDLSESAVAALARATAQKSNAPGQTLASGGMPPQALQKLYAMALPWMEFVQAYPQVDKKSLSREFFQLVREGLHPQAAYERLQAGQAQKEAEQLKAQLRASEKNWRNRQQTAGKMAGEGLRGDPFLDGFRG